MALARRRARFETPLTSAQRSTGATARTPGRTSTRRSGGSSSGSASVVARGLVPFSLGTDTAGSGRVPAGFNNIVGLKPTKGWLSTAGVVPACRTLDCISIFAHDVAEVTKSHPGAVAYSFPPGTDSPILQMLDIPPMPANKTARFIVDHTFTSVSSAVVKGWSLEFRFTCPEEQQDAAAGTVQPTLWVSILAQMSGAPLDLVQPKQAV